MPSSRIAEVAIIGAGLGGLGLALALKSQNIPCTIYEASETPERVVGGSLQLGPNAQDVLARLNVHERLTKHSIFLDSLNINDNHGNLQGQLYLGDKKNFGFDSMRIVRKVLIQELLGAVTEAGIEIKRNKKFIHLLSESKSEGVRFEFSDGSTSTASLLVASDGIYSRVRHTIFPDVELEYLGFFAAGASVARSVLAEGMTAEQEKKIDVSGMFRGSHGALILMPQTPDKADYLIALQKTYPDLGRAGFTEILSDKHKFRAFFDEGYDDWPQYIRHAIDNMREDTRWVFPIRVLPRLPSWTSPGGRVVLIGDAAHAIPPASGQGVNMAFEDGYTLGLILGSEVACTNLDDALKFWSNLRNERIDQVRDLAMTLNKARLPKAERQKLAKGEAFEAASTEEGRIQEFAWLFGGVPLQEEKIRAWISQRTCDLAISNHRA